jgi:hypothetical protein
MIEVVVYAAEIALWVFLSMCIVFLPVLAIAWLGEVAIELVHRHRRA